MPIAGAVVFAAILVLAFPYIAEFSGAFAKSFFWSFQRSAAGKQAWGVNDMPMCGDPNMTEMAQEAIGNAPTPKPIKVLSFEEPDYAKAPTAGESRTECKARVLTNQGKGRLDYVYNKNADGSLYLEARFYPDS